MDYKGRRKGTNGKGAGAGRDVEVDLSATVGLVHEIVSEALCAEVFEEHRTTERRRKWTLFALARLWLAVILDPPPSLAAVLERTRDPRNPHGVLPYVDAEAEAFYQRCKKLSNVFFTQLFNSFVSLALPKAPKQYAGDLAHLGREFTDVLILDGSRLDKLAHRLKILWPEKSVVLAGSLLAVYDVFRGIVRQLIFCPDAASSEFERAGHAIENVEEESLVLGDRLYCSIAFFRSLKERKCYGLFRRNRSVSVRRIREIRHPRKVRAGFVEDWLVEAGAGPDPLSLRMFVLKTPDGKRYEALTNVRDTTRLSAEDAVALYPRRWAVERLFYDLKVVLKLERFYAANPNAAAMQVYAAAMVHTAFRIAQADIAKRVKIPPEEISPAKLFPYLALTSIKLIEAKYGFFRACQANPKADLVEPSWDNYPGTVVSLRYLRVEHRSPVRNKRGFDEQRGQWKSFTAIEGSEELT
jgi:hypothetical protein